MLDMPNIVPDYQKPSSWPPPYRDRLVQESDITAKIEMFLGENIQLWLGDVDELVECEECIGRLVPSVELWDSHMMRDYLRVK